MGQIGPPPLFLVGVGKNFRDERDLPYMEEAILFPLKLVIWREREHFTPF